jgi:hypothetical protein
MGTWAFKGILMRRMLPAFLLATALLLPATAVALPLPGLNGQTTESMGLRVFPEPLQTNDYIGYFEAVAGLEYLNETYPDVVELIPIGKSVGWPNRVGGQREPQTVYLVEVTNEKSTVAKDDKIQLLFMLSIHGNEKGGREGGLRVIEDFAKGDVGLLALKPELGPLLDYFLLIFLFPNVDGWTHDELQYYQGGTLYLRQNANGVDMNRQWPTNGFMENDRSHQTLSEPETSAAANYLKDNYRNVYYASDIHGMLNPADGPGTPPPVDVDPGYAAALQAYANDDEKGHFILGMMPAGQHTQEEMVRVTRLGELVRERLQQHAPLAPWTAAPSTGVWGGSFVRWGAVWETINYQVSGGSHDYFVSNTGLNAPSFSFELSYNHIVCDAEYIGCGAFMNHFHVEAVRMIVATFMEAALSETHVSIETNGHRIAYVFNPNIWTSAEDRPLDGWALENPNDDRWDYANNPYRATPNDFLEDVGNYVRDGDQPAVFDALQGTELTAQKLANYDTLIIAGSAYGQVTRSTAAMGAVKAWVEQGGSLIVTDSATQALADLGVVTAGSVQEGRTYMGYTDIIDRSHAMAAKMIGFSRQTYEGVPIGYALGGAAPNWYLPMAEAQKGKVVGTLTLGGALGATHANYGEIPLGEGRIRYLGALLPDPTQENYHPYGLASYATTYAGNQFFLNMLDAELIYEAPPKILEDLGTARDPKKASPAASATVNAEGGGIPGFEVVLVLLAMGLLVAARRRR